MRKLRFLLLAGIALVLSVNARACRIEGYVPDVPDGSSLTLSRLEFRDVWSLAKATVTAGRFVFEQDDLPERNHLMSIDSPEGTIILFWICPDAQVKISGRDVDARQWRVESDARCLSLRV